MTRAVLRIAGAAAIAWLTAANPAAAVLGLSEVRVRAGVTSTGDAAGGAWLENGRRFGAGVSRELGRRTEFRLDARTSSEDFAPPRLVEGGDVLGLRPDAQLRRHGGEGLVRWAFMPLGRGYVHVDLGAEVEYREARDDAGPLEIYRALGPAAAVGAVLEGPGRRLDASVGYARWFVDGRRGAVADDGGVDRFFAGIGADVRVAGAIAVGLGARAERLRFQPAGASMPGGLAWAERDRYLPWSLLGEARLIVRLH